MANPSETQPGPAPDEHGFDPSDHVTQDDWDALAEAEGAQEQYEEATTPDDVDPRDQEGDDDDPAYDPMDNMTQAELDELEREAEFSQKEYEADLIREALRSISKDAAKAYLCKYGDAVDTRIIARLGEAKQLLQPNHPGPALALAVTPLEITIRFLLLQPLVQGAFLSDRWAAILAARVATGRTAEDREMLPSILREWGVDLMKIKTASGLQVWPFIVGQLWALRNRFVHRADTVPTDIASQAIASAETFRTEVVGAVAKKLGFTLDATQKWSVINRPGEVETYETGDPFADPPAKTKKTDKQ